MKENQPKSSSRITNGQTFVTELNHDEPIIVDKAIKKKIVKKKAPS